MKDDVLFVKDVVENVLRADARARNDDKWLIIQVLKEMGFKVFIPYDQLNEIPAFESITRARRKLQEQGLYPASDKVIEHRREEESKMKEVNRWF